VGDKPLRSGHLSELVYDLLDWVGPEPERLETAKSWSATPGDFSEWKVGRASRSSPSGVTRQEAENATIDNVAQWVRLALAAVLRDNLPVLTPRLRSWGA